MGQRTVPCGVVPAANRGDYRMCGAGARPQIHSAAPTRAVGSAQACSAPARGQWDLKSYSHAQPASRMRSRGSERRRLAQGHMVSDKSPPIEGTHGSLLGGAGLGASLTPNIPETPGAERWWDCGPEGLEHCPCPRGARAIGHRAEWDAPPHMRAGPWGGCSSGMVSRATSSAHQLPEGAHERPRGRLAVRETSGTTI